MAAPSRRIIRGVEVRHDVPEGCVLLAVKRTSSILSNFGRNIALMSIEQLTASCYLQGVEDAFVAETRNASRRQSTPPPAGEQYEPEDLVWTQ